MRESHQPHRVGFQRQLDALQIRAFVIRWWKSAIVVAAAISLSILIISWSLSTHAEGGGMKRRHIGSIVAFIFASATLVVEVMSFKAEPLALLQYGLQALSLISCILTSIVMGMNNIVVDLCAAKVSSRTATYCPAHYLELFGALLLVCTTASIFVTTQQRTVVLVDRDILKGLGERVSRIPDPEPESEPRAPSPPKADEESAPV